MSDSTDEKLLEAEPAEEEKPFRVRDVFQFRREAKPKAAPETPPMPAEPPAIPEQAPAAAAPVGRAARADGHRVPDWWDSDKDITARPAKPPCLHPNPRTFRAGTGEALPFWCPDCDTALPVGVPDDEPGKPAVEKAPHDEGQADEPEGPDGDEGDEDEGQEPESDAGQAPRAEDTENHFQVLLQLLRPSQEKTYARPSYGATGPDLKRMAALEWWNGRSSKTRHLLYNATALGAGYWIGAPQFVAAEIEFLTTKYSSWTDLHCWPWYAVALAVWAFDRRSKGWLPPIALLCRIPMASMIFGAVPGSIDAVTAITNVLT